MTRCAHLEPYNEDEGNGRACTWADAHPERLLDAPRWLSSWVLSGGPNFDPAKHCVGCPGFKAEEGRHDRARS